MQNATQLQATVIFCATLLGVPAHAGGFNLDHQNAAALGAAFAGAEATAADAGFAAYNPAAIADIKRSEISVSVTGILPSSNYSNASGTLLGISPVAGAASGDDVISNAVVPNLSLAVPLTDRLTVGLVANATFGLKTGFDAESVVRYQARASELTVLEVTPMAAFEVTSSLRIGAGLRIQHLDLALTSVIDAGGIAAASMVPGFAPGASDLAAAFAASDVRIGYTAGLHASLTPRFDVGLTYLSKIDHSIEGDVTFNLASSVAAQVLNGAIGLFDADRFETELATPATAALGVRYQASERLMLLGSARRMFWSSFDVVQLAFNDGATPPEVLTQNWRDSWLLSVGGEVAANADTMIRAGFMYDESPVNGAFASPRIPDNDRYWLAVGLTRTVSESASLDLGLAYAFFSDRRIDIDGAAPEDLFRGALSSDFETQVFAASARLRLKL